MKESCQRVIEKLEELRDLFEEKIVKTVYIDTKILTSLEYSAKDCSCISKKDLKDINNMKSILSSNRVVKSKKLQDLINNIKNSCGDKNE